MNIPFAWDDPRRHYTDEQLEIFKLISTAPQGKQEIIWEAVNALQHVISNYPMDISLTAFSFIGAGITKEVGS